MELEYVARPARPSLVYRRLEMLANRSLVAVCTVLLRTKRSTVPVVIKKLPMEVHRCAVFVERLARWRQSVLPSTRYWQYHMQYHMQAQCPATKAARPPLIWLLLHRSAELHTVMRLPAGPGAWSSDKPQERRARRGD